MSLVARALEALMRSPLGEHTVVRGSHVTSRWVPGRSPKDLDVLLVGDWSAPTLLVELPALMSGLVVKSELIWAETEWPGVRLFVSHPDEAGELRVDFGWGDPLADPPVAFTLEHVATRAVTAEVMFGWKLHGLVERGRGRWLARSLGDLVLLHRFASLDLVRARTAAELAFSSRHLALSALSEFLFDPTWGQSRGSRNKWKTWLKREPLLAPFSLPEAIEHARSAVHALGLQID